MTREERAKQFSPFDAMKGLREALREREEQHTRVERHEISEEQMEKNSAVLFSVKKGTFVTLECHRAFHDIKIVGVVMKIDTVFGYLIVNNEKILFSDIYTIKITDLP